MKRNITLLSIFSLVLVLSFLWFVQDVSAESCQQACINAGYDDYGVSDDGCTFDYKMSNNNCLYECTNIGSANSFGDIDASGSKTCYCYKVQGCEGGSCEADGCELDMECWKTCQAMGYIGGDCGDSSRGFYSGDYMGKEACFFSTCNLESDRGENLACANTNLNVPDEGFDASDCRWWGQCWCAKYVAQDCPSFRLEGECPPFGYCCTPSGCIFGCDEGKVRPSFECVDDDGAAKCQPSNECGLPGVCVYNEDCIGRYNCETECCPAGSIYKQKSCAGGKICQDYQCVEQQDCPEECCTVNNPGQYKTKQCEYPGQTCMNYYDCVAQPCPYACCSSYNRDGYESLACPEGYYCSVFYDCRAQEGPLQPCPYECCVSEFGFENKACSGGGKCVLRQCEGGYGQQGQGTSGAFGLPFELKNPLKYDNIEDVLGGFSKFLFQIGLVLAPVMFIIAGLMFVTAGSSPERATSAKKMLLYTVIGLAVVLLASGLIAVIKSIIGYTG